MQYSSLKSADPQLGHGSAKKLVSCELNRLARKLSANLVIIIVLRGDGKNAFLIKRLAAAMVA
jgi:hypothetical protein